MELIANWIDLAWIPVAFAALHKGQRFKGVMFILTCVFALRMQVEFMNEIGHPKGILPLLDFPMLERGYIAYGAFIATFLILSHFSREKDPYVYIAASITVFIAAFVGSSVVFAL